MSYIKLEVRSGGIYIKQKEKYQPLELELTPHPENASQKVLKLVRDSALKGLFSYLMGETAKIKTIEQSTGPLAKKLNHSLNSMVQAVAYQKISEPHITAFFERKDIYRKSSNFSADPNVNLYHHSFETADPTIQLLKIPLKNRFQTESLGEINKKFQESKIEKTDINYNSLTPPDTKNIPQTTLGLKMKNYFHKFQKAKKPIYQETLKLIATTNAICLQNTNFKINFQTFKKSQFSVFESPNFTKVWVDKQYWKVVRGTPAFIACVDFDLFLSEQAFMESKTEDSFSWREIVYKLKNGPSMARWGEGGVVFIQYCLDEMGRGYERKDNIFVEIKALRKAGLKIKNSDKNNIQELQCPKFFEHKINGVANNAKKQLSLNILLEADRAVSSWSCDKLISFLEKISKSGRAVSLWDFQQARQFLKKWDDEHINALNHKKPFTVSESIQGSPKSQEQYKLAQKMVNRENQNLSVCGVDPAGGKTSIALYWWGQLNNTYPLMLALPRQYQVTGLFGSLKEDCKRIYRDQKIKIEGIFNGQRQHKNWSIQENTALLSSDINIMVFDRFLSPYYKRKQSSEFIKMLGSHLVLDEFHEFKEIPKMIPALKEILHIRSWLNSGVKTLMLSGTPEPDLLKLLCVENIFKRQELAPKEKHTFKLSIKKQDKIIDKKFIPDCMYSFLRVESCQEIFATFFKILKNKVTLIHTYFTVEDKEQLLENILKEHGKSNSSKSNENSVIASKMLQSSYNLSFKKAFLELSQPYMDCQTAGRINRFENKKNSAIHFFYDNETEDFFNEKLAGFQKIHQAWKKHLLVFIESMKGEVISIRQLMECYDQFWNNTDNIETALLVLKKQQEKAIKDLNQYIPKRFTVKKNKKTSISFNSLFRGESRLLSACVLDEKGKPTGQLYGKNLLNEGRNWLISKITMAMRQCLKTKSKCDSANVVNGYKFEYNKYISKHSGQNFGFKEERPLLCSHFKEDVDTCLNRELTDNEKNTTDHRVYNKNFGLVKRSILIND